ncbi:inner nuclear membrane protein enriched at telomere/subtelomere region [Gryganskiella cystojenkinii]|nr:inner nuclear membrane protein enriched at telomere/subtelomere region [Gryganskiella cystojenkinii]
MASGGDMPRYLQRNFEPRSMDMDGLRNLLITHNFKAPTGYVKKSQLVALFEQHIRPLTRQLRADWEAEHTKGNDSILEKQFKIPSLPIQAGSTSAAASSSKLARKPRTLSPVERSAKEPLESAVTQRITSKSSASSMLSDPEHKTVAAGKTKQRPAIPDAIQNSLFDVDAATGSDSDMSRGRSSKRLASKGKSESSSTSKDSRRKASQSESESRLKKSEEKKTKKKKNDNFSDENPFQSGSESERRRRSKSRQSSRSSSTTSSSIANPRRSSRRKSRAHGEDEDENISETDRFFNTPRDHNTPFSNYMRTPKYTTPHVNQEELERRQFQSSPLLAKTKRMAMENLSLLPSRPLGVDSYRSRHGHGHGFGSTRKNERQHPSQLGPLWLLMSVCMLSYGLWYCQTRFDVGYCQPNELPLPTNLTRVEQIMDKLYPVCMPCPDHATCRSPKEDPICPKEYLLRPHPFSFNNMLPIPQICVLDKAREYQSLQVADATELILREQAGKVECATYSQQPSSAEMLAQKRIPMEELKKIIESMKDSSINQKDFEQYWELALQELRKRTTTIVEEQGIGETYLRSLRPARPLACRVRQAVLGWLIQYQVPLIVSSILVTAGLLLRRHIIQRREERKIINGLVKHILEKLSEQARFYYLDPVLYEELYIPQIHLRDALLSGIHSALRRQELWDKVSMIVDQNANVRVSTQEVRGEMHRVWEWVGASGLLSMASSLNKNKSEDEEGGEQDEEKRPFSFTSRLRGATSLQRSFGSSTASNRSNKSLNSSTGSSSGGGSNSNLRDSRPKKRHNAFTDTATDAELKEGRTSSLYPSLAREYPELLRD